MKPLTPLQQELLEAYRGPDGTDIPPEDLPALEAEIRKLNAVELRRNLAALEAPPHKLPADRAPPERLTVPEPDWGDGSDVPDSVTRLSDG